VLQFIEPDAIDLDRLQEILARHGNGKVYATKQVRPIFVEEAGEDL
jgi:hypothetical protein